MPLPPNFFSVNSYDVKFMSFKFGNDIFITFEMPRSSFLMSFWKTNISLLFHQSVFRGPCLGLFRSFCLLNCYKERKNTVVLPGNFFFRPSMLCETFLQKQFKFKSFFFLHHFKHLCNHKRKKMSQVPSVHHNLKLSAATYKYSAYLGGVHKLR